MEPLDFPLGLGVTGGTVFLSNTQCCEEVFETVAAAGDAGVGVRGEQVSGIIIKPVDDLNIGSIGEAPMGKI